MVNPAETTLITHKLTPVARFAMKAFGTPGFLSKEMLLTDPAFEGSLGGVEPASPSYTI